MLKTVCCKPSPLSGWAVFVCFPSCMNICLCGRQTPSSQCSYEQPSAEVPRQRGEHAEPPPSGWTTLQRLPCCPWGSLPSTTEPQVPSDITNLAAPPLLASFPSLSSPLPPGFPGITSKPPTTQKNYLSKKLLSQGLPMGNPKPRKQYTQSSYVTPRPQTTHQALLPTILNETTGNVPSVMIPNVLSFEGS